MFNADSTAHMGIKIPHAVRGSFSFANQAGPQARGQAKQAQKPP